MNLKNFAVISVVTFSFLSLFLFIRHEFHTSHYAHRIHDPTSKSYHLKKSKIGKSMSSAQLGPIGGFISEIAEEEREAEGFHDDLKFLNSAEDTPKPDDDDGTKYSHFIQSFIHRIFPVNQQDSENTSSVVDPVQFQHLGQKSQLSVITETSKPITNHSIPSTQSNLTLTQAHLLHNASLSEIHHVKRKGSLVCEGKEIDSEVIYWKEVPGDNDYSSPISPHIFEGLHHDRYLTFEYDHGGWNNIRMGVECVIVLAHAMGRTLVIPPAEHLYLLGKKHKDEEDKEEHDEMGFEDFFRIDLLRRHKGMRVVDMSVFLAEEGQTGGLKGILPPDNRTDLCCDELSAYLAKVADAKPKWMGKFVAFPRDRHDFPFLVHDQVTREDETRMKTFGGDRSPVFYEDDLRAAHHIHYMAGPETRLLQHHYAMTFFADPVMQSFYKRFIRDYMRYRDPIQCAGHELVQAVRADAREEARKEREKLGLQSEVSGEDGTYFAIHIRRGDFQYKDVKIQASDILKNLRLPNGSSIIPPGSLVYLSTDDPKGVCQDCYAQRQPCTAFTPDTMPVGCPVDPSWNAFIEFGWKLRFLHDFLDRGLLQNVNPNLHGMVESIVCSRAKRFVGTYFSTFTGYIHRLRGYHGLGEETFYHSNDRLLAPQMRKSVGHGFSREWRAGWTDDGGELIRRRRRLSTQNISVKTFHF